MKDRVNSLREGSAAALHCCCLERGGARTSSAKGPIGLLYFLASCLHSPERPSMKVVFMYDPSWVKS